MILLTGGTGFIGRHLVRQFVAENRNVRVLSRQPCRVALPSAVSWAKGDLVDSSSLRAALRDVSTVVHAAAVLAGENIPESAFERINAGGTEALAKTARAMGVRQFIHISSAAVYGEGTTAMPHLEDAAYCPSTPYQRSKLFAEQVLTTALAGSDIRCTIFRPVELYGSDRPQTIELFREVAKRRLWLHGSASVFVQPTHIADLVGAILLAMDNENLQHEVFNIGGSESLEFRELISLIGTRVCNVPIQVSAPHWTRPVAAFATKASAMVGKPPALFARLSRACVNRTVSIEKARLLLGFKPLALECRLDQIAAELREKGVQ